MSMILSDSIKYPGNIEDVIMVKHPIDKVFSNTKLEVLEGQEAVICESGTLRGPYCEGETSLLESMDSDALILDVFARIKHQRPFKCKTYFVSRNEIYQLNWGTGDLFYNLHHPNAMPYHFGMSGSITVEINDSVKFVNAFINNNYVTTTMFDSVITAFVADSIKKSIAEKIRNNHMDIYYIDDYMQQLSELLKKTVEDALSEMGVGVKRFSIEHIKKIGKWERPPMDPLSMTTVNKFQELTPSEKVVIFERFSQLLETNEDRALLNEVINSEERG